MVKRMDNKSVVEEFIRTKGYSDVQSHTGNLYVHAGQRLFNYGTCIAQFIDGKLVVNRTTYSNTTSKIQGMIYPYDEIAENVPFNTSYLGQYITKWIDVNLINYFDVWGNKKDGWEVNNLCKEESMSFRLRDNFDNKELFQKLKDVGFIKKGTRFTSIEFEDLSDFGVEFRQKKDGYPLGRIEYKNVTIPN